MRNTLHKSEILRGYSVFSNILKGGEFVQSTGLRCYYKKKQWEKGGTFVRAGFAVARKDVPLAVDRNKVKRLLREAFRHQKSGINEAAKKKNVEIDLVLVFKVLRGAEIRKIRYTAVEGALTEVLAKIISTV